MKINANILKDAVDYCSLTLQKGSKQTETIRIFTLEGKLKLHSFNAVSHNIYTVAEEHIEDFEELNIHISIEKLRAITKSCTNENVRLKLEGNTVQFFIPSKRVIGLEPSEVIQFHTLEEFHDSTDITNTMRVDFKVLNDVLDKNKDVISKSFNRKEFENYFFDGILFSTFGLSVLNTVKVLENKLEERLCIHNTFLPTMKYFDSELSVGITDKYLVIETPSYTTLLLKEDGSLKACPEYRSPEWKTRFQHVNKFAVDKDLLVLTLKKLDYFARTGNVNGKIKLEIKGETLTLSTIGDDSAVEEIAIENPNGMELDKYLSYTQLLIFLNTIPNGKVLLGLKTDDEDVKSEGGIVTYVSDDSFSGIMEMNKD